MSKKRILLIDDEPSFTRMLKLNLEETGQYEVRAENRGTEGLAAAREFKPDLIFLDIVMPDMSRGDVASEIQTDENLKNTPIVFITALAMKKEEGIIAGRPIMAKPVTVGEVIDRIEKHLGRIPDSLASPDATAPPRYFVISILAILLVGAGFF